MALGADFPEYPPKVDIPTQIYEPLPDTSPLCDWNNVDATRVGSNVVSELSEALAKGSHQTVVRLFADNMNAAEGGFSHWKDTLALTAHLRSFKGSKAIASALVELSQLRGIKGLEFQFAQAIKANDSLSWVSCSFHFTTTSPKAQCKGTLMLVPEKEGGRWRVWSMSTWLRDYEEFPEDESRLRQPSAPLPDEPRFTTDVLVIGGGNAGIILAGRLKALGVDFVVVDRNKKVGDNWFNRYDCMRFHTYKSFCHTPYISYPEDASDALSRDELGTQIRTFSDEFDLTRRVLHQSSVAATSYDTGSQIWTVTINDGASNSTRTVTCKCLVVATGAGFSGVNVPDIPGRELFQGPSIHSTEFENGGSLMKSGAKSVAIIGSANTAFDVLGDCYNAGLKTTMIQRSPTYVVPMTYFAHPMGLGAYDLMPTEDADAMVSGGPLAVGGPLLALCHGMQALEEPKRYDAVQKAGLRVQDSLSGDLIINLIDRCGGHFVDMGRGIELITTGEVGIRSGAVPSAYTPNGLVLSDGSELKTDAIVWCTGFGNLDVRKSLPGILGEGADRFASRMESTWGVDAEGEVRGLWKRQADVDNMWVFAGGTGQHRWFSKVIALQIKGVLEGILPEAYRRTPGEFGEGHDEMTAGPLHSNL